MLLDIPEGDFIILALGCVSLPRVLSPPHLLPRRGFIILEYSFIISIWMEICFFKCFYIVYYVFSHFQNFYRR